MTLKAEDGGRPEEIGIVLGAMDIVATEARHAVAVHQAGNEIVPLHSVSTPGAVGKIPGIGSSRVTIVELPEFAQVHAGPKADRPGITFFNSSVQKQPTRPTPHNPESSGGRLQLNYNKNDLTPGRVWKA